MTEEPNAWLPAPLRALAGRALGTALNRALALDPDTQGQLAALDGRSVTLRLRGPELAFNIAVNGGKLRVGAPTGDAALRVATTPGSVLGMLLRADREHLPPGAIDLAGDAELARRLEKLARGFAPDFEEAFARTFGDVLGVQLARVLGEGLGQARRGAKHLGEDAADWLRDESRLAVAPGEVERFLDEVDTLRERSERLAARVARLLAAPPGRGA